MATAIEIAAVFLMPSWLILGAGAALILIGEDEPMPDLEFDDEPKGDRLRTPWAEAALIIVIVCAALLSIVLTATIPAGYWVGIESGNEYHAATGAGWAANTAGAGEIQIGYR